MPTYKNVQTSRREFNGKVVEPQQEIHSLAYYDENEIQLLKVHDKPFYNCIIYSDKITEENIVSIPKKDSLGKSVTKYAIHLYAQDKDVEVYWNSLDNKPSLRLYPGCKWNVRCQERTIDKLVIRSTNKPFTLWVIIERL